MACVRDINKLLICCDHVLLKCRLGSSIFFFKKQNVSCQSIIELLVVTSYLFQALPCLCFFIQLELTPFKVSNQATRGSSPATE